MKKTLEDVDVRNKCVLVRADLNVPLSDDQIVDDIRIRAFLPTFLYLIKHDARVAVCAHLGRPGGKVKEELRLRSVARRLSELTGVEILNCDECIGRGVKGTMARVTAGEAVVLENIRFHPEETANDPNFVRMLAEPFDLFINDAFGEAQRSHASTEGITRHLPSVAGFLMARELNAADCLRENPAHPFVVILGGLNVSAKLGALKSLLEKADAVLIGGAIANTFLKADGIDIGRSIVEEESVEEVRKILNDNRKKIHLPIDVMAAAGTDAVMQTVRIQDIPKNSMNLDIGPETRELYLRHLSKAKTVFWNGPLGYAEAESFAAGTQEIGQAVAGLDALTVISGSDTVKALRRFELESSMSHVSTGGETFLKLLETGDLPAVKALQNHDKEVYVPVISEEIQAGLQDGYEAGTQVKS